MTYYHFLPTEQPAGKIIEPGNFGRMLHSHEALIGYGRVVVTGMLCREMLWECIRMREYPALPSRLDCVFLLPTKEDADAYGRLNNADGRQILHRVAILDGNAATHAAWISHCTMQSGGSFLDQMAPKAHAYWGGKKGDTEQGRELIVAGAVQIVCRVG